MNGVQDMGGKDGFGPISPETTALAFANPDDDWEVRCAALFPASVGAAGYNIDEFRHGIESAPHAYYLTTSYYEHWLYCYEELFVRRGIVSVSEIEERIRKLRAASGEYVAKPGAPRPGMLSGKEAPDRFWKGVNFRRTSDTPPRYKVGDRVRTRNIQPLGHTRLPGYLRTKVGRIVMAHGVFVFPDTSAMGNGEKPQGLYTVEFAASEVWGDRAGKAELLHATLWDDYMDPAGASHGS